MSSTGPGEPDPAPSQAESGGLLLFGEGMARLSDEHVTSLWNHAQSLAGSLTVQAARVPDVSAVGELDQLERGQGVQSFDLTGKSPEEICQIEQDLERLTHEDDELGSALTEAYFTGFRSLIVADPTHGARLVSALAEADDTGLHISASMLITDLARVDPAAAIPIWRRLLHDDDSDVATGASEKLLTALERGKSIGVDLTPMQVLEITRKDKHS